MESDRRKLLMAIRDHLQVCLPATLQLSEIAEALSYQQEDFLKWIPTTDALLINLLELQSDELREVMDFDKYDSRSAVDSMIISGQEIYERFEQLSPAKYLFVLKMNPDLYKRCQAKNFMLIEQHLRNNLEKGIESGEYRNDVDNNEIIDKYMQRIKAIHSPDYLKSEHFTFANIFTNIFEDYLKEVATEENWHYFRKRKQFYEAISFVNR
ncbi:hypothetical protein [Carboxylicivirga taeanensis]|uniref:hypothetical protein n=1 Tax=Carboxylicivirga taeanensis TaxID=1416875 RepID=UPI003F6DC22A